MSGIQQQNQILGHSRLLDAPTQCAPYITQKRERQEDKRVEEEELSALAARSWQRSVPAQGPT